MKPTKLLKVFIQMLKETAIITYNKDFLKVIGFPVDVKHIKRLSDYIRRDGDIRDKSFLIAIENRFDLPKDIWNLGEGMQIRLLNEAIERELDLKKLPDESSLDVSDILCTKAPISSEQKAVLEELANSLSQKESEDIIDKLLAKGMLDKRVENQEFLVELIKLAYEKGMYLVIVEFLLPNLFRRYQMLVEVQKIEAHTLGSLAKYEEAKHILDVLIHHNTIENINLKTSALSNHKRAIFANDTIDADELFTLVQGYKELHAINGIYSYYTGINLAYMAVLGQILFPKDNRFLQYDIKEIYDLSKKSLQEDNTHNEYYRYMSEFEFLLLLGREGVDKKIESFLEHYKPHPSLVERSLRQMNIFTRSSKNPNHKIVKLFVKVSYILKDYISSYPT